MQLYNTALAHPASGLTDTRAACELACDKENTVDQVKTFCCYASRQAAARVHKSLVHLNHGQNSQETTTTNRIPGSYLLYGKVMARYGGAHSGFITSV